MIIIVSGCLQGAAAGQECDFFLFRWLSLELVPSMEYRLIPETWVDVRENRWLLAEGTYGWVGSDLHNARYAAFFVFSFIIIIFAMFHCLMIDNT